MQRRDVRTSVPDSNTHHTANGKRNVPEGRTKTRENVQENKNNFSANTEKIFSQCKHKHIE
jgi:hypothetical protein